MRLDEKFKIFSGMDDYLLSEFRIEIESLIDQGFVIAQLFIENIKFFNFLCTMVYLNSLN